MTSILNAARSAVVALGLLLIACAPSRMGVLTLSRCAVSQALCGDLARLLDPTDPVSEKINIHFELYRHSGRGPALGTIVATEGGPGYPATLSHDDYWALFEPLLDHRDLLIMDNRGTGKSHVIDCAPLQTAAKSTTALIGACGRSLGSTASLYSTAFAADDLVAVLDALEIKRIDLYGDSYGTYFGQVFAARHPQRLRSLVLDGAYPLDGEDYAWYPHYAPAMRDKFNLACERSPQCARLPGTSIDHIRPALQQLREHPFAAEAFDVDGNWKSFRADAGQLATVMFSAAPPYSSLRETDAAARALVAGDAAPMLRLMAEASSSTDSRDASADAAQWSAGLAVAVMCQDTPQVFDMRLQPEKRRAQFQKVLATRAAAFPDTYAPFTFDEYRALPLDYGFIEQCVEWPVAPAKHAASQVVAAGTPMPDVPALIVSGEFDNVTSVAEGSEVVQRFSHGRQLILANSFHVNALPRARAPCAAQLVRRFVTELDPGDTACIARVPEMRLAADFARSIEAVEPAEAGIGNAADELALRCARAAVLTAGDVVARLPAITQQQGRGLRGGRFTLQRTLNNTRVELEAIRWSPDLSVSGTLDWPDARGVVRAALNLRMTDRTAKVGCHRGHIEVRWPQLENAARAHLVGRIDGAAVVAEMPAP